METSKQFLRPADIAPLIGVCRSRVYQLIADGTVPSIRVGAVILIPVDAWTAWLKARSDEALASVRARSKSDGQRAEA